MLAAGGGVAATASLVAVGVPPASVDRHVARGELRRLRRGVVLDATLWETSPPSARHALRARGTAAGLTARGVPFALTHHSALAVAGLPVWGVDDLVHVARTDGRRGPSDRLVRCHRPLPDERTRRFEGLPVVDPAHACLQVASRSGVEAGLISADAALRAGVIDAGRLSQAWHEGRYARWASAPRTVVDLAHPGAESPAESRARWLVVAAGLPPPVPQAQIVDDDGDLVGRVDLLFEEERTILEIDGMLKYDDPQVLRREKLREDRLRELGYEVVRVTWAELSRPDVVKGRLLRAFARSAARRRAGCAEHRGRARERRTAPSPAGEGGEPRLSRRAP